MITIKKHILFVCTGNTCRSPFAEGMMKQLISARYGENAGDVRVSSAGTYAFTGVNAPPEAIRAAEHFKVDLTPHRSRSIHLSMMEAADVVFCMTTQHRAHLVAKFPWFEDRIHVLRQYALGITGKSNNDPVEDAEKFNIPDPIGQGQDVYRQVYEEIRRDLERVLDVWEQERDFRMKMSRIFKIAIGSDHAGFLLKSDLIGFLQGLGHEVKDFGTSTNVEPADYPDFAKPVAQAVANGEFDYGVLICGSGVGVNITANRVRHARAVLCREALTAKLSRLHDDCNILCLGERFTPPMVAHDIIQVFLATPFEGGRHEKRVKKIEPTEK